MGHSVLLVEDNPAMRESVTNALELRGHTVFEAPDGETALFVAARCRPAVVLVDLGLPDTNGFGLVPKLRERIGDPETVIIALSGYLSKLEETRLAAVGFDDVIAKPLDPSRVVAAVEAHLPSSLPDEQRLGTDKLALIVDDDPHQLNLMRSRMRQLGFEVATAGDGQSALTLAIKLRPDVLIVDALMPNADGFELATAVRRDPALQSVPFLLVSSSYFEPQERLAARRAGATDLVVRTADLSELVCALQQAFAKPVPSVPPEPLDSSDALDGYRLVRQLERQLHLNGGLAQRCSSLSAEVAVLSHVSELVLTNQSFDDSLPQALAACFDAAGFSSGALYRIVEGRVRAHAVGTSVAHAAADLEAFFGHEDVLWVALADGEPLLLTTSGLSENRAASLLSRSGSGDILLLPLRYRETALGALVVFLQPHELDRPQGYAFAQAVANQLSQVLALAAALDARARAEQLAQERTAFFDALLEQAPDLVMYLDPDGVVRYASSGVSGVIDQSVYHLLNGSTADELRVRMEQVLSGGESVSWEETTAALSGVSSTYWCKMGPISREGGVTGALIVARDISERKRADAQLVAADRMLSVGVLAAGVAHEINNPLAALVSNLDLLRKETQLLSQHAHVPAEVHELLVEAADASERIRTIVRDLRVFSRAEEDGRSAVNVEHLLESTLRMARAEVRHRATVVKSFAKVPPVQANEARLGQVFLNLVINAAQAIPEGHADSNSIRISTSTTSDGNVLVRIADTGTGIPMELQSRVFSQFFTTKPPEVGTGLGLSICQRIVQSIGGSIDFCSEPGVGTEFRLVLPLARFMGDVPVARAEFTRSARRARLLVVDDEPMVSTVIKRFLEEEHEIVVACSAAKALNLIAEGEVFDLILCDLMMPQITGMHMHRSLLDMSPQLADRMVFMTGGAFTPWARQFLGSIPNPRIEKPFDGQNMRKLINRLIVEHKCS